MGAAGMRGDTKELRKDTLTDFGAIHQSVDDDLKGPFAELTDFVWPLVTETWEEHLKPTFEALVDFIRLDILPTIEELKEIWGVVWGAIKFIIKVVALSIETQIGTITAVIRGVIALLKGDWEGAWQAAQDFVEETLEWIVGFFDAFGVDLVTIWKGIWEDVKTEFHNITDPIIGFIQKIIDKVKTPRPPSSLPSKIGGSIAWSRQGLLGKIPGFADGVQNFGGGPAVVGERGPELVNLPRGSSVTPNGAGGNTYVFNFPNYVGNRRRPEAHDQRRPARVPAQGQLVASVTCRNLTARRLPGSGRALVWQEPSGSHPELGTA